MGTVNIEPSPDSSETDVQIGDGALPEGIAGRTYSDGRILLDIDGPYPQTGVTHEFGHTLRLGHDESGTVMDEDPYTHPSAPTPTDEAAYYAIWGEGRVEPAIRPSEGTPVSNSEPTDGGGEAVYPLPDPDKDSFTNEWSVNEGTDFSASEGTPVSSLVGGKVVQNEGSQSSVMIQADQSAGTVQKGDMVFLDGIGNKDVSIGDKVTAGQQLGEVGSSGLHLGLYDPTGERAESGSGAYDSYTMMNWLVDQDGEATGTAVEGPACETPQGSDGASGGGTAGGSGGGSGGTISGSASSVVAEAENYMGVPYLLGGPEVCVPGETMDCTCLTTTVYREFGYELPDFPAGHPRLRRARGFARARRPRGLPRSRRRDRRARRHRHRRRPDDPRLSAVRRGHYWPDLWRRHTERLQEARRVSGSREKGAQVQLSSRGGGGRGLFSHASGGAS